MASILILDDDPSVLKFVSAAVTKDGFEAAPAVTVGEAISLLEKNKDIQVALVDIRMPGRDGMDFLKIVRANLRYRRIPVLMLTGYADPKLVVQSRELGALDYLLKPVTADDLNKRVQRALESRLGQVLVVSPNEVIRSLILKGVEREGHDGTGVASIEEALGLLKQERISMIISDIDFPEQSGFDILVAAKELSQRIAVILLIDEKGAHSRDEVIAAGADGFLTRPLKNVDLARKLAGLHVRPQSG